MDGSAAEPADDFSIGARDRCAGSTADVASALGAVHRAGSRAVDTARAELPAGNEAVVPHRRFAGAGIVAQYFAIAPTGRVAGARSGTVHPTAVLTISGTLGHVAAIYRAVVVANAGASVDARTVDGAAVSSPAIDVAHVLIAAVAHVASTILALASE